ncbi:hypothetical protein RHGRI_017971 [Rhododendron griersonianum]|uniref:3'-5' exonuclease domain-containing protein n=1 Tax=Rhododendron griersonianum TaxID=479676 RepID=A0AAV6JZU7_9ERIC|nr:hypothetical protein RHGRI_017971 [Rhododendron griersonianum]
MMPQRFMSKLDTHQIQFDKDRTITVKVVDEAAMVSPYLAELKSLIGTSTAVGLSVRYAPYADRSLLADSRYPSMLQLSVGTRFLLIQLRRLDSIPECLKEFLADPEICFVGVSSTRFARRMLKTYCEIELTNGIDVSDLAAKVLN